MKRLILEVFNDDWYFRTAEFVILTLHDEEIAEVKELSEKVRRHEITEAAMPHRCSAGNKDYAAGFQNGKVTLKEYEKWMDAVHLHIGQDSFIVTGFYGYSNVSWRTAPVPLAVFDEEGDYDMR